MLGSTKAIHSSILRTMGGRRRHSQGQGIRKRKNPRKQTLAVVAERKEQKQAKIQRQIGEAEERNRQREARALGIEKPHFRRDEEQENALSLLEEENDHDVQSQLLLRKMEGQQTAYDRLVGELKKPMVANGDVQSMEAPSVKKAEEKKRMVADDGNAVQTDESNEEMARETRPHVDSETNKDRLQNENHAAAIREKKQFESSLKPVAINGKLSAIGFHEELGKISGIMEEEHRSALQTALKEGFHEIGDISIGMRPSVYVKWQAMLQEKFNLSPQKLSLDPVHRAFISLLREYRNMLFCSALRERDEQLQRNIYVAHCLSHVLRCRGRILRNNALLKSDEGEYPEAKDQGFSRARVLILLPMKNVAYDVVKALMALAVGAAQTEKDLSHVGNSERFENEFAPDPDELENDEMDVDNDSGIVDSASSLRTTKRKPKDHKFRFRGNIDDDFKLGISFSKKTMRLYTDFYSSDIIIASPLGLRRAIAEKATGQGPRPSKATSNTDEDSEWKTGLSAEKAKPKFDDANDDFLSSIEICIVDGANVFSMQNWNTLLQTMGMINKMPENTRDTDFSRVKEWCLDGLMAQFRQTVILSAYRKSEFVSLFRDLVNHAGKVQLVDVPRDHGSMTDVVVSMRQTFFKVPLVETPESSPEKRLKFFFDHTLPRLRALVDSQSLVIVPNYLDYVRVRNRLVELNEEDDSFKFASMCEYSKGTDISRARSRLFGKTVSMVVMTERFHFFWRHWIRGADTIVWYGLPENCHFYPEILNMTADAAEVGRPVQSLALYDTFDAFALERIVGQSRAKKMVSKKSRSTFLFV